MSQNTEPYKLDQPMTFASAKVKNLEKTLNNHEIRIPPKALKPELYRLFYYLCQTKKYSIIPKSKNQMNIDDYIKLHTTKSNTRKRKTNKAAPPTKRQQEDKNEPQPADAMNDSDQPLEYCTMNETDHGEPPRPLRTSTPTEIISIDDDIVDENFNEVQFSFDEKIFEKNSSKLESISLNDNIFD